MHSMIKHVGKAATYSLAPYICAKLRERAALELLKRSSDFYKMCADLWRSRHFLDSILILRMTPQQLNDMSRLAKIKAVYQCSLECEHENTSEARSLQVHWKALRPDTVQKSVALPDSWQACVSYWKHTFRKGLFFSMPLALFEQCLGSVDFSCADCPDPIEVGLQAVALACSQDNVVHNSSVFCFSRW